VTTAERVILYTVPHCGTCDRARRELTEQGVDFEERNIMLKREWFDEAAHWSISVPVIMRGDKVSIGWGRSMGCHFQ
jgi:glutaredoxin